jgi:hypothetical protein
MNWKTEIIGIGVLAAAGYLIITNIGKISGWLGDVIFKPAVQAINPVGVSVNEANPPTGNVIQDIAGQATGTAIGTLISPIPGGGAILSPNNPIGGALLSGAIGIGGAINQATPAQTANVQSFVGTLIGNFEKSVGSIAGMFFKDPIGTLTAAFNPPLVATISLPPPATPLPYTTTTTTQYAPGTANRNPEAIFAPIITNESEILAWIPKILAEGTGKLGTVGGLSGTWVNYSSTGFIQEGASYWSGVSEYQRQALRNIDLWRTDPLIKRAIEKEIAERGGAIVIAE